MDSVYLCGISGWTGEDGDIIEPRDAIPPRIVEWLPLETNQVGVTVRGVDPQVLHSGRGSWREKGKNKQTSSVLESCPTYWQGKESFQSRQH